MVPFGSTLLSVSGSLRQAADEENEFTIANALSSTLAHTHTHNNKHFESKTSPFILAHTLSVYFGKIQTNFFRFSTVRPSELPASAAQLPSSAAAAANGPLLLFGKAT